MLQYFRLVFVMSTVSGLICFISPNANPFKSLDLSKSGGLTPKGSQFTFAECDPGSNTNLYDNLALIYDLQANYQWTSKHKLLSSIF